MGTSENFCLRWNDFEANVSGAFRDLRAESDFFDVTLGCSDGNGRSLQAHKVILSACSNFFKQMLRQQSNQHPSHPHPFIYLRGVSYCDLSSVLDFMYHGEVNVAQEDLNSFLAVAEELQIKGLTNKDGETSKKSVRKSAPSENAPSMKRARRDPPAPSTLPQNDNNMEADVKQVVDIKTDPEAGPSGDSAVNAGGEFEESEDFGAEEFGDSYYNDEGTEMVAADVTAEPGEEGSGGKGLLLTNNAYVVEFPDGRCRCKLCDKIFKSLVTAQKHIEIQHTLQKKVRCSICQRVLNNKYCFRSHVNLKHKIFGRDIVRCYGNFVEDDDSVDFPLILS